MIRGRHWTAGAGQGISPWAQAIVPEPADRVAEWQSAYDLPFPLVEVADQLIRHDYELETAGDLARPKRRNQLFNLLFLVGFGLGFVLLFFQASSKVRRMIQLYR